MTAWLLRLMGVEDGSSLRGVRLDFDAAWAHGRPALTLLICAAIGLAAAGALYRLPVRESAGRLNAPRLLAALRAAVVAIVAALCAEPFVNLTLAEPLRPLLVWLFDGTQSMAIRDRLNDNEHAALSRALEHPSTNLDDLTRLQIVQRALNGQAKDAIDRLNGPYRQRAYLIDRVDRLRELPGDAASNFTAVAEHLTAEGLTTALGAALDDVGRRHGGQRMGGVVLVSDFDQNAGPAAEAAADRLGVPVYAVGVGPRHVADLSVQLQAPLVAKKDEPTVVTVHVRQTGLEGRSASIVVEARSPADAQGGASSYEPIAPPRQLALTGPTATIDLPFTPRTTGRYALAASIEPLAGEVMEVNNRAERAVVVRDESLKLLFVEHEPTWEWRFVKQVFHRDRLVGRPGFRTFLQSADVNVRRRDELFIETLFQPRGELLSHDVIILSDVPGEMLPDSFQRLAHEFVERFGGGLVVIAGPRHGLGSLRGTMIADMLPVVIDADRAIRDEPFELRLTAAAERVPFMRLNDPSADAEATDAARDAVDALEPWSNLGPLPWFQPVARPHPLATVLAHHPADLCADGRTPQPIIAMRRYGRGEVVYIGFNELWRLRRLHGERYHRRFWAGVIYRLGLSRALGSQKRFQVGTDRSTYQAGDTVRITVEAYDEAFNPLNQPLLTGRLVAEADLDPGDDDEPRHDAVERRLTIPLARDQAIYETTATVDAAGEHRLLVRDPVTEREVEAAFHVAPASIEQRDAVRNVSLQQSLASRTGGKAYELHELTRLAADIGSPRDELTFEKRVAIGHTWAALAAVLMLLLGEWALRARWNLR